MRLHSCQDALRGEDGQQQGMFLSASLEDLVPADHLVRPMRATVDEARRRLDDTFDEIYGDAGRTSIAPERLLRAQLLMLLHTIRSERLLIEQLDYNLLLGWFVGLEMDEDVWNHAVFSKNRQRLLNEEVAGEFFRRVLQLARPYLSDEHFTVDGTLIEAWAR